MNVAFIAVNDAFCGTIEEEMRQHHVVKKYVPTRDAVTNKIAQKYLHDWADLVYFDFIQSPMPWMLAQPWFNKKCVARMDGIDVMNHNIVKWRKVDGFVLMPVQEKRLRRLRGGKLPLSKDKILIRNIGIDLEVFKPDDHTPGWNIVFHSNVMREVKRPYLALQCFHSLLEQDDAVPWHLTMIGGWEKGWDAANRATYVMCIRELLETLNIPEDRLTIRPNLTRVDWADYVKTMDIIWCHSWREGFPNSVGEAAASGVHPLINHFYGAETIYPDVNLCKSPIELVEETMIWGAMGETAKRTLSTVARQNIEQYSRRQTAVDIRKLCERVLNE